MGGGQALSIGFGHIDLFSAIGSFSGAIPNDFETRYKSLLDDPAGTNAKLKLVWIGCGKQDSLFPRSEQLAQLMDSHKIKNVFFPIDGRHNYTAWRKFLIDTAPRLFR
jgi:enterochelin esterase-like enzyme